MRSNPTKIALAALLGLSALACSHAKPPPTTTVDEADGGVYEATAPAANPATPDEGSKLAAKDDGDAKSTSSEAPKPSAPPAHTASPEVKSAFAKATGLAESGDTDGAISTLKSALAMDPKLPWAHYDLGALYERKRDYATAIAEYRKALDVDPQFGDAGFAEARLLLRQKRLSEAEGDLRARIEKQPAALGLRNALVYTLVQEGQLDGAAVEAKKVLKADEKNAEAMFQLATVYFKQGKNELALMVLTNAAAIRPDDPQIHNAMGFVHIALKEKAKALEDFKQAAALSPDFAEAHNNLGALLNEAQDYPAAVKELELAVRDAPDFVAARLNLGNAYRGNQQYPDALAQYQKVLELAPSYRDALFNLAVLYFDGDFPQLSLSDRLNKAGAYFDQYRSQGGDDGRVDQYKKDLAKLLAAEKRRQEREAKDKLKKAQKAEQEAKKAQPDPAKPAADGAKAASGATLQPASGTPGAQVEGARLKVPAPASTATPEGSKLKESDAAKKAAKPDARSAAPTAPASGGKLGGGDEK